MTFLIIIQTDFFVNFLKQYKLYENCVSGARNEDRHSETDAECERREHQEVAGDASDQGGGQRGGGSGPSTNANGGSEAGDRKTIYFIK